MSRSKCFRWLLAGCITAGSLAVAVQSAPAVERVRDFLEGLRERGYYDAALDYLEQMRTSPLAGKEFKELIDYEAGATLIASSRAQRSMSVREKQLAEARERFTRFAAEHPQHSLAAGAKTQLANLRRVGKGVPGSPQKVPQVPRPKKGNQEDRTAQPGPPRSAPGTTGLGHGGLRNRPYIPPREHRKQG